MQDLLQEMEAQNVNKFIKVEEHDDANNVMSDTESEKARKRQRQLYEYGQDKVIGQMQLASTHMQKVQVQVQANNGNQNQNQQQLSIKQLKESMQQAKENEASEAQRIKFSKESQQIIKNTGMRNACGKCCKGFVRSQDLSTHLINVHKRVIPFGTYRNGAEEMNDYIAPNPIQPIKKLAQAHVSMTEQFDITNNKCGGCYQTFLTLSELTNHVMNSHNKVVPIGSIAQGQPFTRQFIMMKEKTQDKAAASPQQKQKQKQKQNQNQNQNQNQSINIPIQQLAHIIQQLTVSQTQDDRDQCGICIGSMFDSNKKQVHQKLCPAHKELFNTFEYWNRVPKVHEIQSLLYIVYNKNNQNNNQNMHECTQCENKYQNLYKLEKHIRIRHATQNQNEENE